MIDCVDVFLLSHSAFSDSVCFGCLTLLSSTQVLTSFPVSVGLGNFLAFTGLTVLVGMVNSAVNDCDVALGCSTGLLIVVEVKLSDSTLVETFSCESVLLLFSNVNEESEFVGSL